MRRSTASALCLACAVGCLAREYELVGSFGDAEEGGADSGGTGGGSGGSGGKGGSVSATGGDAGDDPGSGGSFSGSSGQGGTTSGGASGSSGDTSGGSSTGGQGGSTGGDGSGGGATGGVGGTGAAGGKGGAAGGGAGGKGGSGGKGGAGAGGTSGKGGTGGVSGGGSGGKGGTGGVSGGGTGGKGGSSGGGSGGACGCIVHRYSFSITGTVAEDSVGSSHGTIVGGTQGGNVVTLLGGTSDQYVSLPSNILAALTSTTFEFWVSWAGGTSNWQRVFDFGSNDGLGGNGQGSTNSLSTWISFTPRASTITASPNCMSPAAGLPRVAFTLGGPAMETCVFGASAFPTGTTHAAVTISGTVLSLYINGVASGSPAILPASLGSLTNPNNWLGRSQFSADTEFAGTISEFRIYNVGRTAAQIAASYSAGPDSVPSQ